MYNWQSLCHRAFRQEGETGFYSNVIFFSVLKLPNILYSHSVNTFNVFRIGICPITSHTYLSYIILSAGKSL